MNKIIKNTINFLRLISLNASLSCELVLLLNLFVSLNDVICALIWIILAILLTVVDYLIVHYPVSLELKQIFSNLILSIFMTYSYINSLLTVFFKENGVYWNINNKYVFLGAITFNLLIFCLIKYLLIKDSTLPTIITLLAKLVFEFEAFSAFLLFVQMAISTIWSDPILFNILGIVNILILIISFLIGIHIMGKEWILYFPLKDEEKSIFRLDMFFNLFQSSGLYLMLCSIIIIMCVSESEVDSYRTAFLILSFSGLLTVISYWFQLEKLSNDRYFRIVMLVITSLPFFVFLIYDQGHALGNSQFSKVIFALILGIGAILLLILGEDSQIINNINISDSKNRQLKLKISKYRLRVSNGVILATFVNVLFGDKENINSFIHWLSNFDDFDQTWLLVVLLAILIILILVFAFILAKAEVKIFGHWIKTIQDKS